MKKVLLASAVAAAIAAPTAAMAQMTGNVSLASEYIYRGIAQTRGNPALQGGFDYSHSSGLYAGVWGSNISWLTDGTSGAAAANGTSSSLEIDVYGGYKGTISGDLGFDVGLLTYNYPGDGLASGANDPNTTEVYMGLSYKWLSAKYSVTTTSLFGWNKTGQPTEKTKGSGYLDLSGSWDLGSGFGLSAHAGHQSVKGRSTASYSDYKLALSKDLGFGTVGLAYTTTNAKDDCSPTAPAGQDYCAAFTGTTGYSAGKDALTLSFGKTF